MSSFFYIIRIDRNDQYLIFVLDTNSYINLWCRGVNIPLLVIALPEKLRCENKAPDSALPAFTNPLYIRRKLCDYGGKRNRKQLPSCCWIYRQSLACWLLFVFGAGLFQKWPILGVLWDKRCYWTWVTNYFQVFVSSQPSYVNFLFS